jgi:hypothetical protein
MEINYHLAFIFFDILIKGNWDLLNFLKNNVIIIMPLPAILNTQKQTVQSVGAGFNKFHKLDVHHNTF